MAYYTIEWTTFGTALIEANSEEEALKYLEQEQPYDEAWIIETTNNKPSNMTMYFPVSLDD